MSGCDTNLVTRDDLHKAKRQTQFIADISTGGPTETVTNPDTGVVVPTIQKILAETGFTHSEPWDTNPRVTEALQVIPYNNQLFLPNKLPYQVDSASHPDPNALVPSDLRDVSNYINSDKATQIAIEEATKKVDENNSDLGLSVEQSTEVLRSQRNITIGDQPLPFSASKRDAFQVARNINGLSDCHAFADKTVIQSTNDAGTYGTFDSQTEMASDAPIVDHQFSFQDRATWSGSGTLSNWGNIIWPKFTSAGTCASRIDFDIKDAAYAPGAKMLNNIGIRIASKSAIDSPPISFNSLQNATGFSFLGFGGGVAYNQGPMKIGGDSTLGGENYTLLFNLEDSSGNKGAVHVDSSNGLSLVSHDDKKISFIANSKVKGTFKTTASFQDAFTPGTDNLQPLGDAVNRWSVVFAGTDAINTSDGRLKTEPKVISDDVLDAWGDVSIITYKWLDSIAVKGGLARTHFGVIAQQVRDAFEARDIDATKFGLLCYDKWEESVTKIPDPSAEYEYDNEGNIVGDVQYIEKVTPAGDRWGIRPSQCLFLEAAYQRRENERMKSRLDAVEKKLGII